MMKYAIRFSWSTNDGMTSAMLFDELMKGDSI